MRKGGKGAHNKNKNVLNKLEREINRKANPVYNKKSQVQNYEKEQEQVQNEKVKLKSKIETSNGLNDYFDLAHLSQKQYDVIPEQQAWQTVNSISIVPINQSSNILIANTLKNSSITIKNQRVEFLSIPKRPKWTKGVKKEEFEHMEREAFLGWRKALAEEEEKKWDMTITPFEKNLEVWKQLWLVSERCQLLFQIVDGRNPLYFRCPDWEPYIKGIDKEKQLVLIVNKADLMSKEIRDNWGGYFKENGIKYLFFSAWEELDKIENNVVTQETPNTEGKSEDVATPQTEEDSNRILSRNDLIKYISHTLEGMVAPNNSGGTAVTHKYAGFIGYPNVGKSSIINVLMKTKKVGVAMMPGKTKHYQTLFLPTESTASFTITEKSICLMDCPGLVFPSFTASKADMLVNGIFPIDTIKDYHSPIQIIVQRIPSKIWCEFYKITLPDIYSAKQFLQVLAEKRGFVTGASLPDEAKTAKMVLKDYVSGKLVYCYLRPDYTEEKFGVIYPYKKIELTEEEVEKHKMIENIPATFDENYEKLYYENEKALENKKVIGGNVDEEFFEWENQKDIMKNNPGDNDTPITKDMKREWKFAMKRGDITEEDFESVETVAEYKEVMGNINKIKDNEKNNRKMIETKVINF